MKLNLLISFVFPEYPPWSQRTVCTMDDVRGDFLGPPHGRTPAAVIAIKLKVSSFKGSDDIYENQNGPYHSTLSVGQSKNPVLEG